jgi:hypothetical protein
MTLWPGVLSAPSWHNVTSLAYEWAFAYGLQTITNYLWGSGAAQVKHCSRYDALEAGACSSAGINSGHASSAVAPLSSLTMPSLPSVSMMPSCKGRSSYQGADHYRNGAGTARQEYALWGISFVWAIMRIPLQRWPGHHLRLPMASHSLSKKCWPTPKVPYRSRSSPARRIKPRCGCTAYALHPRSDGWGLRHQDLLRHLPPNVHVVRCFFLTVKLYQAPPERVKGQRGAPPKRGNVLGSTRTLATPSAAWQLHPQEAGAFIQSWVGMWHSVFPGWPIRVVVVWRPHLEGTAKSNSKKVFGRLKPLEAFFSTATALSPHTMLAFMATYMDRWAWKLRSVMAIPIRHGSGSVSQVSA